MALQWPEEQANVKPPRRRGYRPGDPLSATGIIFELDDDAPSSKGSRFRLLLATLIAIALLVAIGLTLAYVGPLPTIFPRLDCGACEIHN